MTAMEPHDADGLLRDVYRLTRPKMSFEKFRDSFGVVSIGNKLTPGGMTRQAFERLELARLQEKEQEKARLRQAVKNLMSLSKSDEPTPTDHEMLAKAGIRWCDV